MNDKDKYKYINQLNNIKIGDSITIYTAQNVTLPILLITRVNTDYYTCLFRSETHIMYLVEDLLYESSFLSYIERKLSEPKMRITKRAALSAIYKFFECHGDISHCIEWITGVNY